MDRSPKTDEGLSRNERMNPFSGIRRLFSWYRHFGWAIFIRRLFRFWWCGFHFLSRVNGFCLEDCLDIVAHGGSRSFRLACFQKCRTLHLCTFENIKCFCLGSLSTTSRRRRDNETRNKSSKFGLTPSSAESYLLLISSNVVPNTHRERAQWLPNL